MRKIILAVFGIIMIAGSIFGAIYIVESNVKEDNSPKTIAKPIAYASVKNQTLPIIVKTNGQVAALNKFQLFSEVQGIFEQSAKVFRPGQNFKRGETLLKINNQEFMASVQSSKSDFFNLLISILPDIRLDYPEQYEKWNTYIENFSVDQSVKKLPKINSNAFRYFVNGRGILTAYYNLKNLEARLEKFTLKAPFDGVLTEALITPGTLVRPGQALGEFINPNHYELEVALQKALVDYISVGDTVNLIGLNQNFKTQGIISRINKQIDQSSQTVQVFIRVDNEKVREGMYLEAEIFGRKVTNAFKIDRSLILKNSEVFIVKDATLALKSIQPIYYSESSAIVKGLEDGDTIMTSNLSSAYSGMLVELKQN